MNRYFRPTFITIFIIIIWDALKNYLNLGQPIIQLAILLPAISIGILDNLKGKLWKTVFSRPALIWLVWIIYALINTFFLTGYHPSGVQNEFVFISSIVVAYLFFLLIIVCKSETKDLLNVLIFAFFCRLLLSVIFDTLEPSGLEYIQRFGIEFNSNIIAIGALFLISLILLKYVTYNSLNAFGLCISVVALLTIFFTASRKTYLALVVLIAGLAYMGRSKYFIKNILLGSLVFIILFFGITWTLANTTVGERMLSSYERTIYAKNVEQMFDHRAGYFVNGWELFKDHPINGIGLKNYPYFNQSTHNLHTEYMVQLTECGLIGISLFVFFYWYIIKWLLLIRTKIIPYKTIAETYLVLFFVMFFLFLGAWKYNIPIMWVLIALAVRFIKTMQERYFDITVTNYSV